MWKSMRLTEAEAEQAWRAVNRARSASKPRHTDARLREAAQVYRAHLGRAPTEAVPLHFQVAHSTAAD